MSEYVGRTVGFVSGIYCKLVELLLILLLYVRVILFP